MPNYEHKYGGYTFPATMPPSSDPRQWLVPDAKQPRTDGGIVLPGYRTSKEFEIRGSIVRGPLQPTLVLRDQLDDLIEALSDQPQDYTHYDDRYWRCVRVRDLHIPYEETAFDRLAIGITIKLITADPFQYSRTENTDTWTAPSNGGTRVITLSEGNAKAAPIFQFTVDGAGTVPIAYTLSNDTTGEEFGLAGDVSGGDVIEVDCLRRTVMIGAVDMMYLFSGVFPTLDLGANTFTIGYGATAIDALETTYQGRWK